MFVKCIASILSGRHFGGVALAGAFAALLGVSVGCQGGGGGPVNVPLQYRPAHADPLTGTSINAADVKVHLAQVVDKRQNKEQIGQNVEDDDKPPIPVYAAEKTPAEFLRGVMQEELRNFGIEQTEAPEAADRIITVELNKFWVEEGNNYVAQIQGIAQVTNKGGSILWKGPVAGDGRTFGRSLSPANYNEALSDAARRTVGSMTTNPGFVKALSR
jgi:hypothetical protein